MISVNKFIKTLPFQRSGFATIKKGIKTNPLMQSDPQKPYYFSSVAMMLLVFNFAACSSSTSSSNRDINILDGELTWLIAEHEIIDGGPGQDGIPSIDDPVYIPASEADYLSDERRVLGVKIFDEIFAYPIQIMDWHEVVNDDVDGRTFSVTYCPLTATGIVWDSRSEFGTSGLLYRNNLVAYDRNTESLWSQMLMRSVNGERIGESTRLIDQVVEVAWKTWKEIYPQSKVLSTNTGFDRDYNSWAYGKEYEEKHDIFIFPPKNRLDTRLQSKSRVHALFPEGNLDENSDIRVYELKQFDEDLELVEDTFDGKEIIIAGSRDDLFAVSFEAAHDRGFKAVKSGLPVILETPDGTRWDLFGEAVSGPLTGEKLDGMRSYTGYWFGLRDIFSEPEIYIFE